MKRVFRLVVIAGIVGAYFSPVASALSGPQYPCLHCDSESYRVEEPQSGIWWNPERPGSGITFDIQDGTLGGGYYGYDEAGNAQWWTFAGQLIEDRSQGYALTVTANLVRYTDGACLNCDYQAPTETMDDRRITISFTQANHGTFKIDDGEVQGIVPFVFGVSVARTEFGEGSEFSLPDLEGQWLSYFDSVENSQPFSSGGEQIEIGRKGVVRTRDGLGIESVVYTILRHDFPDHVSAYGGFRCYPGVIENGELSLPTCDLIYNAVYPVHGFDTLTFNLSLGDIGESRIEAYSEEFGLKLVLLRVNYFRIPGSRD